MKNERKKERKKKEIKKEERMEKKKKKTQVSWMEMNWVGWGRGREGPWRDGGGGGGCGRDRTPRQR